MINQKGTWGEKMDNIEILCKLDKGQIDVDEALALLKRNRKAMRTAKGNFMKISIRNGDKRFPVLIPLCLLNSAFSLSRAVTRLIPENKQIDGLNEICKALEKIDKRDFSKLLDSLRYSKEYPLVKIEDDYTIVDIRVI